MNMGKIGTVITLSESEQRICGYIAHRRTSNNRLEEVSDVKVGNISHEIMDLEGFAAEFAFCKLFNIFPDFYIGVTSSKKGNDKGDAVLFNGMTVDVKSTTLPHGKLLVVPWKKRIDLFALMTGTFPTYTFKGFMDYDETMKKSRLEKQNPNYPASHAVYQRELKELEDLIGIAAY